MLIHSIRKATHSVCLTNLSAIIQRLAAHRYQGWFVVEAEQDPIAHPPAQMASQGYQAMHRALTAAGYSIHR
jgi:inosose dehydratase